MDRHADYGEPVEEIYSSDRKIAKRASEGEVPLHWSREQFSAERAEDGSSCVVAGNGKRAADGMQHRNHATAGHGIHARKVRAETASIHGVRAAGGGISGGSEPGNCRRGQEWVPSYVRGGMVRAAGRADP